MPNISEKICWFLPRFQGIFTKVVFLENVRVSFPGNQWISRSQYLEINWFLSNNTRKSIYSGYCDPEINWFPGNDTRTFSKKTTFVNIPWNLGKNQKIYSEIIGTFLGIVTRKLIYFRVTIPRNQLIAGYRYPAINWFLGTKSQKSINFGVLWPGSVILRKKFEFFYF